MRPPSENQRRRWIANFASGALLIGGLMSVRGLASCAPAPTAAAPVNRPVTAAQAQRLAAVRLNDYKTGHVGVRATIGSGTSAVHLNGWLDWQAPLVYLNRIGAKAGPDDGLIQAIPGVVAFRAGRIAYKNSAAPDEPFPPPPEVAPPTGWQVRPPEPTDPIDTLVTLLFTLRSGALDDAGQIQAIGTRFVSTAMIGGVRVDVLDGAAVPPARPSAAPTTTSTKGTKNNKQPGIIAPKIAAPSATPTGAAFAAQGGQVRYWVDDQSRLLRAEALVNTSTGVRVDFDRTDVIAPRAIELLGGAAVHPKAVTAAQAKLLAGMRMRDYGIAGGRIALAIPNATSELISGTGWMDWQTVAMYMSLRNNTGEGADGLLRADVNGLTLHGKLISTGTTSLDAPTGLQKLSMPPLNAPKTGWRGGTWQSRIDQYGQPDLDLLLNEMLGLSSPTRDNADLLRPLATKLRTDHVNDVAVTVFEIRKPVERNVVPGDGRLRYWVDSTGLIRRLEVGMRNGAYGYLTFTPGPVPKLPSPK